MQLTFFNTTEKELKNKPYNIFIGISMGIKPLDNKLAMDYIQWSLEHTKEKVVILIADEIAKINYKVFSGYSEAKSHRKALQEGDQYFTFFNDLLSGLSEEQRKKVIILRWKDISTERLNRLSNILDEEFLNNPQFKSQLLYFVKKYSEKRGRDLDAKKLDYLAKYLIFELPTILEGIEFKGIRYGLLLYPTFVESGMSKFAMEIENSSVFSNLRKRLGLQSKIVLVEAYIKT